ncbi:MAG: hypothetical protein J0I90_05135, partial [Nitrosospira sp.]|nr:hypothetical protein [Nitrosospira sp.]
MIIDPQLDDAAAESARWFLRLFLFRCPGHFARQERHYSALVLRGCESSIIVYCFRISFNHLPQP